LSYQTRCLPREQNLDEEAMNNGAPGCIHASTKENARGGCIQSGVPRGKEQLFFHPNNTTLSGIIHARNSCHVRTAAQQRKSIFTSHHWTGQLSAGIISPNLILHIFYESGETQQTSTAK
jgi:hypothetical protein